MLDGLERFAVMSKVQIPRWTTTPIPWQMVVLNGLQILLQKNRAVLCDLLALACEITIADLGQKGKNVCCCSILLVGT